MSLSPPPLPPIQPTWPQFQAWWQQVLQQLIDANNSLQDQITAIAAAEAAAAAAQTTANTVHVNDSISSSWTSPGTILSASGAGPSASVAIAGHDRKYNDGTAKPVTGSSVTGLAYSTKYFIYYDDSPRAGGAVTFHADTDPNVALPGAEVGRHYCGEITTPVSGGTDTSGGVSPPGSGGQLGGSDIP